MGCALSAPHHTPRRTTLNLGAHQLSGTRSTAASSASTSSRSSLDSTSDSSLARAAASPSSTGMAAPPAAAPLKLEMKEVAARYKGALQLKQRVQLGKQLSQNDRGTLLSALATLYKAEEAEAEQTLLAEKRKRRAAAAMAAAAAAASAGHASAAASSAAARSIPVSAVPSLPSECQVCFAEFNSECEGQIILRMRMTLCGHASICVACFTQYLTQRIESDDVMPFIPCPEPGCKLPLSHCDIAAVAPSTEAARAAEAEMVREVEVVLRRNTRAAERKAAREAEAAAAASSSDTVMADVPASAIVEALSSPPETRASRKKKKQQQRKRSKSSKSSSPASSAADDDSSEESQVSVSPDSPLATRHVSTPLLSNALLLRLVLRHLHSLLLQSKEWLPCGTHVEAPAVTTPSLAASAEQSSAGSASSPSTAAACPFGFLLSLPLSSNRPRLKKCDLCGVLQSVKPKESDLNPAGSDASLAALIADGMLRPCPACDALQAKDFGMCNILQCHSCHIWWNWRSRETGKNSAVLKDRARAYGTLWENGELQYQLKLQRDDPEAFKALLARNGIEYRADYIRGHSH